MRSPSNPSAPPRYAVGRVFRRSAFIVVLGLALLSPPWAAADPTTGAQAETAVRRWLALDRRPLKTALGGDAHEVKTFRDPAGAALYHVVRLEPAGFIIVAGDDRVEPIIAFVRAGSYDPSPNNPLGALVGRDLPARVGKARGKGRPEAGGARPEGSPSSASPSPLAPRPSSPQPPAGGRLTHPKWGRLLASDSGPLMGSEGVTSVSDVRVPPFVESSWNQEGVGSGYCYNYYTPAHYDCGCVATAMAQVMRYFQFPTAGPGTPQFDITVDGWPDTRRLRGGNGAGGPYDWANMVLVPDATITTAQRQAIGALCFDASVSLNTDFAYDGSGAYVVDIAKALTKTFGYSNAIGVDSSGNLGTLLLKILNTNLDAGRPIALSIDQSTNWNNGHAIVCDGYGYNASTLYHHLNFGWSGLDDAWYNLPNLTQTDSGDTWDVIDGCAFNVYVTGSDEIISGRITDVHGAPISGVAIQATASGGAAYTATTNSRGIYAIEHVPSSTSYTVTCAKTGYGFGTGKAATGRSASGTAGNGGNCGNVWGVDIHGGTPPPAPASVSASDGTYQAKVHVTWAAVADATSYDVWRNTANDLAAASPIASSVAATSYDDTTVAGRTVYWYWVRAKTLYATGPFSSPDSGYASGVPVLQVLSTAVLDFGSVIVGESKTIADAFSVKDIGTGTLKVTVSVPVPFHVLDGGGLPASSASFSLEPGEEKALSFDFAPVAEGPVSRVISFTSNGGNTTRTAKGVGAFHHWTLEIDAPQGSGTTAPKTGSPLYRVGTSASVKATPAAWWAFDHWEGTGVPPGHATDNPIVVPSGTVDQTLTLQAVFVPQWALQIQAPRGSGTTAPVTRKYRYNVESPSVPVQATPALGWVFDHWAGTGVAAGHLWDNPIIVPSGVLAQTLTLQAIFVQQWTLAIQAPQGSGATNPEPGNYVCNVGTSVAPAQATPAPDWVFDHWVGTAVPAGRAKNNPLTVPPGPANQTRTLQAVFVQKWTLAIQAPQGSGKTAPGTGSAQYTVGVPSAPVKATPASGWFFDHWEGTGVPAGHATDNPITVPSGAPVETLTLQAVFVQKWTLAIQAPQGSGTTAPPTGSTRYTVGTSSNPVQATGATGWAFGHWVGTGVPAGHATDNPITVPSGLASQTLTLHAVFVRP